MRPDTLNKLSALIAENSISSVLPEYDESNEGVIHLLANWCRDLGFEVAIMPVQDLSLIHI